MVGAYCLSTEGQIFKSQSITHTSLCWQITSFNACEACFHTSIYSNTFPEIPLLVQKDDKLRNTLQTTKVHLYCLSEIKGGKVSGNFDRNTFVHTGQVNYHKGDNLQWSVPITSKGDWYSWRRVVPKIGREKEWSLIISKYFTRVFGYQPAEIRKKRN